MAEAELGKIVNMIMENPELVEKIRSMADSEKESVKENESENAAPVSQNFNTSNFTESHGNKRNELLRALSSFLSAERQKSLETMMTIANVLDTMKK